jgi:hypothetical protein
VIQEKSLIKPSPFGWRFSVRGFLAYFRFQILTMQRKLLDNFSGNNWKSNLSKGTLSVRMLTKKIVQVRIKITQSCKLYQSILWVPENQKNFCALDFRLFEKPSISRRFAIFNLKLLIYKELLHTSDIT